MTRAARMNVSECHHDDQPHPFVERLVGTIRRQILDRATQKNRSRVSSRVDTGALERPVVAEAPSSPQQASVAYAPSKASS